MKTLRTFALAVSLALGTASAGDHIEYWGIFINDEYNPEYREFATSCYAVLSHCYPGEYYAECGSQCLMPAEDGKYYILHDRCQIMQAYGACEDGNPCCEKNIERIAKRQWIVDH